MRYFKDNRSRKIFSISAGQEYLIHLDWQEISQQQFEKMQEDIQFQQAQACIVAELTQARVDAIMERLIEIDVESVRPLRAIATHTDVLLDHQKLSRLNEERQALLLELGNKPGS